MLIKFSKTYFICFILLLAIEIVIATFSSSGFIRSVFGDFLVVIMIYCFVKSLINAKALKVAVGVLIFAYLVELLQLFNLIEIIGLQNNKLAILIIGNTFQISDIIAYTLGICIILSLEYIFNKAL